MHPSPWLDPSPSASPSALSSWWAPKPSLLPSRCVGVQPGAEVIGPSGHRWLEPTHAVDQMTWGMWPTCCVVRWKLQEHTGVTYPPAIWHSYWKWPIYRGFTYSKWWFSIAMLNDQRVSHWGWWKTGHWQIGIVQYGYNMIILMNMYVSNMPQKWCQSPNKVRLKVQEGELNNHEDFRHCATKPIAVKVWKTFRQRSPYHVRRYILCTLW